MKLTFCGGVGMVTGSNFLLEDQPVQTGKALKILVDCGLMQGGHSAEERNWEPFPYDPKEINYLVVTHAHIDHIGRIPKLVREGFRGTIISTKATLDLAAPMLEDSMQLLKMAAEKHNRPILYDQENVAGAIRLWHGVSYHEKFELPNNLSLQLRNAGHILGAGIAQFTRGDRSIAFTGDLGSHSELLDTAEFPEGVQYLVMESVYGDRTHDESVSRMDALLRVIEESVERGGTLLIPAFSTERTQDLLFDIRTLMAASKIPGMPVFLDSPLAIKVTQAFMKNPEYFKPELRERIEAGENIFEFPKLHIVENAEESHHIEGKENPKIILAGSGMSAGGRVLAHEKVLLPDVRSTICIVGYQSVGSIGRRLLDGEKKLEIMGESVPVRAGVEHIFAYSAHKDSNELLEFASEGEGKLEKVFVVMGEPAASTYLAQRLRDYAGLNATVPEAGESVEVTI